MHRQMYDGGIYIYSKRRISVLKDIQPTGDPLNVHDKRGTGRQGGEKIT